MSLPLRLSRAAFRVSGPDTIGLLQNLLSQSVDKLAATGVAYAALLTPQGKLFADMLMWDDGEGGVLIEADVGRVEALRARLALFKLRAAVAIEEVASERVAVWSTSSFEGARPDPRLPALGWRALAVGAEADDGEAAYLAHRVALGVPDPVRDAAPEEVFALEALLEELNGVDFHKGCFPGQENVSRMKRRATTRKKFCPVVFDATAPPPGTPVLAGAVEIGSVRAAHGERALALLRLDRALSADALSAGGAPARLDPPDWLILPAADASG